MLSCSLVCSRFTSLFRLEKTLLEKDAVFLAVMMPRTTKGPLSWLRTPCVNFSKLKVFIIYFIFATFNCAIVYKMFNYFSI